MASNITSSKSRHSASSGSSGYYGHPSSTPCSSTSSKSRHSASSGSSGYYGHPSSTLGSSGDEDHKKKKSKVEVHNTKIENGEDVTTSGTPFFPSHTADKAAVKKTVPACVLQDAAMLDMSRPTSESKVLQVAVLAQALFCIQTKANEQLLDDHEVISPTLPTKQLQTAGMIISALKDEGKHEREFCIVVSLSDGTVAYTTASLTNVLGFPKDMWIGRSLTNFLHPKDRIPFASHITSSMAHSHFRQKVNSTDKSTDSDYFYCWIRMYNGLKTSGFSVTDKKAMYLPCQLTMNFKEVPGQGVFLIATARVVKSAYTVPGENRCNPSTFTTRHTLDTLISHVDNDVVSHFGYLPHDMIGRSIFDFYYAEDLPYLKDVYTNVIMEEGLLSHSRPYKFRCQNGDCVMVETEWSSFINPWGKKLEFIIGRHRVLTGPHNTDVVIPVLEPELFVGSEVERNKSKAFEGQIKVLLTEPIVRSYEPSKQQLALLVESLQKISSSRLRDRLTGAPVPSAISEMLGEISPHHVYSDSKSSSETPLSYNQLTYNENMNRFFASEPKTAGSDESRNKKTEQNQSSMGGGVCLLPNNSSFNRNSDSCLIRSGNRSENSSRLCSNQEQRQAYSGARQDQSKADNSTKTEEEEATGNDVKCKYLNRPLTEEMLYQHNRNMNKQMAQKHKNDKSKSQDNGKCKNARHKTPEENKEDNQGPHGMKRSVSHSWEGEPIKAFKGADSDRSPMPSHNGHVCPQPASPNMTRPALSGTPFSIAVTVPSIVQPSAEHISYSSPVVNPIVQLPCVYMNTHTSAAHSPAAVCSHQGCSQTTRISEHPCPPHAQHRPSTQVQAPQYKAHQAQYMPSLMYQLPLVPMAYTQSHIVSPKDCVKPRMSFHPHIPHEATLPQQAISDSFKKENKSCTSSPVNSPGSLTSHKGKAKTSTFDNDLTRDGSSSCSYSSLFPKTEKSDDSMTGLEDKENVGECKSWRSSVFNERNTALRRAVRKEPSWMENVEVTADLMLRYQMDDCVLSQVLQSDFEALRTFHQPDMVNEQLDQLYMDLEGVSKHLTLEERSSSSCSSSDEKHDSLPSTSSSTSTKTKRRRKFMGHDKCSIIFEEDAPMPPSSSEIVVAAQSS